MNRPCALTIGNFDGVHAAHRCIMRRVLALAREHGWQSAVLTFDPHPAKVVAPQRAPRLLTTIDERCALMRQEGIDRVEVLPFTPETAALTPEQFVRQVLVDRMHARAVLVGENFRFGKRASGDTGTLRELGRAYGFTAEIVDPVRRRGRVVSSTEIRRLIEQGNVSMACRLLERPYALEGAVVHGHGIGSKQTVPTLNLDTAAEVLPATGVYITRTRSGDRSWPSITNVGFRPTFAGDHLTIETHLLSPLHDEAPDRICIEFLHRLRPERKFPSPQELKSQILKDAARAQTYFRRTGKC